MRWGRFGRGWRERALLRVEAGDVGVGCGEEFGGCFFGGGEAFFRWGGVGRGHGDSFPIEVLGGRKWVGYRFLCISRMGDMLRKERKKIMG